MPTNRHFPLSTKVYFQLPSGPLYFRHYEVGLTPRPWICMGTQLEEELDPAARSRYQVVEVCNDA
eukprot:scaffold32239_cov94-Phaeocystis_antarctica.AAC.3